MQIILVSRHLKSARTIHIMPRHIGMVFAVLILVVLSTSALFSWMSVHFRLPIVEELVLSRQAEANREAEDLRSHSIQMMATRIGELQARVLHLDSLGEQVSSLSGFPLQAVGAKGAGKGGPFVPVPLSEDELQKEIDRLARAIDTRVEKLELVESRLLEKRVRERLLPTSLPVREAELGSFFGHRSDPISGMRAMHQGIDFNAEAGTPVLAAADGVVLAASYHADYGNVVDLDHGDGLVTRYAHLARMDVVPGALARRGKPIGTLGSTGRSTGPHLHFEVRMHGVAQNPALFLKQGREFAELKRR